MVRLLCEPLQRCSVSTLKLTLLLRSRPADGSPPQSATALTLIRMPFVQMASMRAVRGSLGAVSLNGCIWAVGGGEPGVSLETVEMYDPNIDAWTPGEQFERISSMRHSLVVVCAQVARYSRCIGSEHPTNTCVWHTSLQSNRWCFTSHSI